MGHIWVYYTIFRELYKSCMSAIMKAGSGEILRQEDTPLYQKEKISSQQKRFYLLGWLLLAGCILFYLLLLYVPAIRRIPCWFRLFTGFYCPGCGATRAFVLLCRGRLRDSIFYYPAVLYAAVLYIWFMVSNSIHLVSKGRIPIGLKFRNLYLYIGILLILGNWIVKNLALLL